MTSQGLARGGCQGRQTTVRQPCPKSKSFLSSAIAQAELLRHLPLEDSVKSPPSLSLFQEKEHELWIHTGGRTPRNLPKTETVSYNSLAIPPATWSDPVLLYSFLQCRGGLEPCCPIQQPLATCAYLSLKQVKLKFQFLSCTTHFSNARQCTLLMATVSDNADLDHF